MWRADVKNLPLRQTNADFEFLLSPYLASFGVPYSMSNIESSIGIRPSCVP